MASSVASSSSSHEAHKFTGNVATVSSITQPSEIAGDRFTRTDPLSKPAKGPSPLHRIIRRPSQSQAYQARETMKRIFNASPDKVEEQTRNFLTYCQDNKIDVKDVVDAKVHGEAAPILSLITHQPQAAHLILESLPYGTYADGQVIRTKKGPRPANAIKEKYAGLANGGWGVQSVKYADNFREEVFEGNFKQDSSGRRVRQGNGMLTSRHHPLKPGEEHILEASFLDNFASGEGTDRVSLVNQSTRQPLFAYAGNFAQGAYANSGTLTFANGDTIASDNFAGPHFQTGVYTFANGDSTPIRGDKDLTTGNSLLFLDHVKLTNPNEGDTYEGAASLVWRGTPEVATHTNLEPHGRGIIQRTSGESFDGNFEHGLYANGTQTLPDRRQRTGNFEENQLAGLGVELFPNGVRQKGVFQAGVAEGLFFITPQGEQFPRTVQTYTGGQPTDAARDVGAAYEADYFARIGAMPVYSR